LKDYVAFFDSGHPPTLELLGGKCASLVSMTSAGLPVPPGFAVTTAAFDDFVDANDLRGEIDARVGEIDPDDVACVERVSADIRAAIESRELPGDLQGVLHEAHGRLMSRCNAEVPLAVRSSATAEDLPHASFAGQQDTYLWLTGYPAVGEHIRRCWASLYTGRAITYRRRNGIAEQGLSMGVAVQKMVNARVSGVAMTLDPTNGDRSKIVIDASWGIGELVVAGRVTPDNILLDKVVWAVIREHIGDKHAELVCDPRTGSLVERAVEPERRSVRCLSHDELLAVAALAKRAEKHYGCPQDVEWAIDPNLPAGDNVMLLQSRPETVHSVPRTATVAHTSPSAGVTGFSMAGLAASLTRR
jgi:pyruvate,water dikinase